MAGLETLDNGELDPTLKAIDEVIHHHSENIATQAAEIGNALLKWGSRISDADEKTSAILAYSNPLQWSGGQGIEGLREKIAKLDALATLRRQLK